MKNNTAILDTKTKLIKFMFNNQEFTVDIKEGDIDDSWNCITTEDGVLWDFNFCWENEKCEPSLTIYALTEKDADGYQSTIWDKDTSIEIVEIIGNSNFFFEDKDFEFNGRLNPVYEVFNGKGESFLKTKSLNKASDTGVTLRHNGDADAYIIATDSNGATLNLTA